MHPNLPGEVEMAASADQFPVSPQIKGAPALDWRGVNQRSRRSEPPHAPRSPKPNPAAAAPAPGGSGMPSGHCG